MINLYEKGKLPNDKCSCGNTLVLGNEEDLLICYECNKSFKRYAVQLGAALLAGAQHHHRNGRMPRDTSGNTTINVGTLRLKMPNGDYNTAAWYMHNDKPQAYNFIERMMKGSDKWAAYEYSWEEEGE